MFQPVFFSFFHQEKSSNTPAGKHTFAGDKVNNAAGTAWRSFKVVFLPFFDTYLDIRPLSFHGNLIGSIAALMVPV